MTSQRLPGVLWLTAGISSGGIAFFLVDLLDLAIFIGGALLAVLLALAMLVRPSPSWVAWSNLLGAAWLLAFGAVIVTSLTLPGVVFHVDPAAIEEVLSVVWVLAIGLASAVVTYTRSSRSVPGVRT